MVGMWLVHGRYMVGMWSVHSQYVVGAWKVCGWCMVGMWLVHGTHVVSTWLSEYVLTTLKKNTFLVQYVRFTPTLKSQFLD